MAGIDKLDADRDEDEDFDSVGIPSMGDTEETKSERWKRVANSRLAKVIERLRQMQKMKGSNYEYTVEDVDLLVEILTEELDDLRNTLLGNSSGAIRKL